MTSTNAHSVCIGFLINPIAGMGGRVNLKGTDGVADEARRRGAQPIAQSRAVESLKALHDRLNETSQPLNFSWVTCAGTMGADALKTAGFPDFTVLHESNGETGPEDTLAAVSAFTKAGVDIILFCGGDGTARDICSITGINTPILGIPSGVKMFSGVFGISPAKTADILKGFLGGRLTLSEVDVLDLDEARYRQGEWAVRLYQTARTPYEPAYTQAAKMLISESTDADAKEEIAAYLAEEMGRSPEVLFLLGPGSTVQSVGRRLGSEKTLLGIDAFLDSRTVERDLSENNLLGLVGRHAHCKLILSPIGAQGFILGRGNLQLSPEVIRNIGEENLIIVATPAKLARTPLLRFDTADPELDRRLTQRGYLPVIVGYRRRRLVKVAP